MIVGVYPHWFTGRLETFIGRETRLPVDQHMLVALSAPRPVLLVDGDLDSWANPPGAQASAVAADAAWRFFGDEGFGTDPSSPLQWQLRAGDHSVEVSDWTEHFLPFLAAQLLSS